METAQDQWLREYALTSLRLDRLLDGGPGTGTALIYRGPEEWSALVAAEEPPQARRVAEAAERMLDDIPFDTNRARYLAAHVRALRAVALRQAGRGLPDGDHARDCLGLKRAPRPRPESDFEAAHELLDTALPRRSGSLADRLHAWQAAHTLERVELLPELVRRAVAESRARTRAFAPLPDDDTVECRLVSEGNFHGAGHFAGGSRGVLFVNTSIPFNVADLLYLVTHEVYPGHIAESMLKEIHLVGERGWAEQQVRFMIAPSFVVSEGLGLVAEEVAFPDDQAQAWLHDNVLPEIGIRPDGSDFAAVHRARNVLWGVWGNAALMAAEGRDDTAIADYLARWALLDESETATALGLVRAPGMETYILGYDHGYRLVRDWLDAPDRLNRARRLLTEQFLPADLRSVG